MKDNRGKVRVENRKVQIKKEGYACGNEDKQFTYHKRKIKF